MQRFSSIKNTKSDNYLPHIEGLRALALLGVLLFHFDVHPFSGGYAGVDVFFTISGYLITRNIFLSYQAHNYFSLSQFYISRFRRLYPAATITVLFTVIVSLTTVSKNAARETAGAGLAAMFISANTYFYLIDDYYAPSSFQKPLLHMWSLSLEEQFYLLWAPFIVLLCRSPRNTFSRMRMLAMITLVIFLSLAFSLRAADNAAMFSFFHLPARIYQFAIGGFLALWQTSKIASGESRSFVNIRQSFQSVLAVIAFMVISLSYVLLPKRALSNAMLPVALATSTLIALPNAAICKRLLSCKLAVFLGQLSYSAYLVHWPLYVHWRFVNLALSFDTPNPVLVFLATIVLAKILKLNVEDPARASCKTYNIVVSISIFSTLTLCLVSYKSNWLQDFSQTDKVNENLHISFLGKSYVRQGVRGVGRIRVIRSSVLGQYSVYTGLIGDCRNNTKVAMTFFGNSFTEHLHPSLYVIGKRRRLCFRTYTAPGCVPRAPSYRSVRVRLNKRCRKIYQFFGDLISELPTNATVVLASYWNHLSPEAAFRFLEPIANQTRALNLNTMFIGEPPGIAEYYKGYFYCLDLFESPAKRFFAPNWGSHTCRQNLGHKLEPRAGVAEDDIIYNELFEKRLKSVKFKSVFKELCSPMHAKDSNVPETKCSLPVSSIVGQFPNLTDVGYLRDGLHLSISGSIGMSNLYENLLFGKNDKESTLW